MADGSYCPDTKEVLGPDLSAYGKETVCTLGGPPKCVMWHIVGVAKCFPLTKSKC